MVASPRDERILTAAEQPPRRAQSWLFALALLALVLGTVAGVLVARHRALRSEDRRAVDAATQASDLLEAEVARAVAGLSGAAAVVAPDGTLDVGVFEAFAGDLLLRAEEVDDLLLAGVDGPQRYPVLAVAPAPDAGSVVGRDLGEDPAYRDVVRRATRAGAPTVSGDVVLPGTGARGIAVVRPLLAPSDGAVLGVVATGIPLDRLAEIVQEGAGPDTTVALVDGDEPLAGAAMDPRDEPTVAPVRVAGREWTVTVLTTGGPDLTVAWLVGAGGAVAVLAMLALLVVTVRQQRQLARANALLVRGEERSRAGQEVAGRLARALGGGDVANALFDHLPDAVGARSVVIATMDRAGQLRVLGRDDGQEAIDRPGLGAAEPGSIVDTVVSQHQPAWLSSPLGWRGDELTARLADAGSALAVLPLRADDVVGVLAVAYPHFHIFRDDEQALLQTVAVLAAQALARGRRYDAEHQAAVAFQRAALPDALPTVPGIQVAARYRPATQGATVGGDWYDVLALRDDRVLLVVGDVVGHGMVAAAAMGRLRTAFQTIVPFDDDPGAMLHTVSQQVETIPDAFAATVLAVQVDLHSGRMRWCRAGHPPPLLVRDGTHRLLDDPCLPPLGVAPEMTPPVHCDRLQAGDLLVLYTDGVVERRTESLDRGFRRLGLVSEQLVDLDPEEFCDALVEAMVPAEEQTDDLAVLVVRYEGDGR